MIENSPKKIVTTDKKHSVKSLSSSISNKGDIVLLGYPNNDKFKIQCAAEHFFSRNFEVFG